MIAARGSACAGAGDVGRRAVHRLEQRRPGAGRVQVGRGGAADPAGDRAAEVGEDVAEQVVGDDHVVAAGILHEVDARGVDVVVRRSRRRGTRRATSSNVRCQRSPANVSTLVLCTSVRCLRSRDLRAGRTRSGRTARRPCACSPSPGSRPRAACPCAGTRPRPRRCPRCSRGRRRMSTPSLSALGPGHERTQVHVEVELEAQPEEQAPLDHARRDVGRARPRRAGRRRGCGSPRGRRRGAPRRRAGSARRRGRTRTGS